MTKVEAARSDEVRLLASDVDRLIKRMESDLKGSRVLDHAIMRWLFGEHSAAGAHLTTDLKAALSFIEKQRQPDWCLSIYGVFQNKVTVTLETRGAHFAAAAHTPELALCLVGVRMRYHNYNDALKVLNMRRSWVHQ